MTNRNRFIILLLVFLLPVLAIKASTDWQAELANAEEALKAEKYDEAFSKYRQIATKSENPLAKFTFGLFFKLGWGRTPNPVEACRWFEQAAYGNIPLACHYLAECMETGIHSDADRNAAIFWYKKAAELGHHQSLCNLADLYLNGNGDFTDIQDALGLYEQAFSRGVVYAAVKLGKFYLESDPPTQDYNKAYAWFSLGAQNQLPESQYFLGLMMRDGIGRPGNPDGARFWLESAAAQGYVRAYFPTGLMYFNSPTDPETDLLPPEHAAKAYLWLSAVKARSKNKNEISATADMLTQLNEIMPDQWCRDLDIKVEKHLAEHPSNN